MTMLYIATLVSVAAAFLAGSTASPQGTCLPPTSLTFIEKILANISAQLAFVKDPSSLTSVGESLTGFTSLLHLSLLREVIGDYKQTNISNNEQGLAILKRIESNLNECCTQAPSEIKLLQVQVSHLSSMMSKMESNIELLLAHANITHSSLSSIDDKLDSDDDDEYAQSPLLPSCQVILNKWPNSPSGYYSLVDTHGHARHVYCHMDSLCNSGGGWRRIANLNMTNSSQNCPSGFRLYTAQGGVRACGRPVTSSGSCVGIAFPSSDLSYSQVCGKVIGYQVGWPDAFNTGNGINSYYGDGISLTHGNPRKHIWSFVSGADENFVSNNYDPYHSNCPCNTQYSSTLPSFVNSDFYCESGNPTHKPVFGKFYSDRLWDGKGCGNTETTCCQRPLIPWFYKSLGYSTTDSIDMRLCLNEGTSDEDVPIEQYEIYVK